MRQLPRHPVPFHRPDFNIPARLARVNNQLLRRADIHIGIVTGRTRKPLHLAFLIDDEDIESRRSLPNSRRTSIA